MTQTSRPWNGTITGDAGPYSDAQWQTLYQHIIGLGGKRANVGVFLGSGAQPNEGLRVQATAPASTSIQVLEGGALVQGVAYLNDATVSFTIAANSSGNPRIDTVVVRADYALQTCRLAVLQGTAAVTPVPPSLTQSAGVLWEIPIADIAVANGFSSLAQSTITSRREWVNAPPGVYLDNVLNNSGVTLQDGDVVIWDYTADRAITTTTTTDDKALAGVWRGRTASGSYGRVQTAGIGYVNANAAITRGNLLVTSTTAKQAAASTGANNKALGHALETTSGSGFVLTHIDVHVIRDEDYILVRDEKTSGTAAQTLTLGAWRQRDLNTEVTDTGNFASVTSNQITLEAGTYEVQAAAGIDAARVTRLRLRNVTDSTTLAEGISAFGGAATLSGLFTITAQKVLQLQQWPVTSGAGGNAATTGETEKYAFVYLIRKNETP